MIAKLLDKLGYISKDIHVDECNKLQQQLCETQHKLDVITNEYTVLETKHKAIAGEQLSNLKEENEKLLKYVDETNAFADKALISISKAFHDSEAYKFPRSLGFPGSLSTSTVVTHETNKVITCGRVILDDAAGAKLHACNSWEERYNIIRFYLKKYGAFERIGSDMFNNGAVNITLGYNNNNDTYEVYFHTTSEPIDKVDNKVYAEEI